MGDIEPSLHGLLTARGQGIIMADAFCKFKRPVTFPDALLVGVRTVMAAEEGASTITQHYKLLSQASGRVAAEG